MDAIISILNSLKIDSTVIIQFIIFVVFFNLIAPLFFKRLQAVIDLREEKTTKLDSNATDLYKKVEELDSKYNSTIEKAHQENQVVASQKKSEISATEKVFQNAEEAKLESEYEAKRAELLKEVSSHKAAVLSEAEKLSNSLVEKLTK